MRVITRNGWFRPDGTLFHRLEPWTTAQDLEDDLFDQLPSSMIIVVPPAGYRFKKGIDYSNGDFQPNVPSTGQAVGVDARWPTKADVERIPDEVEVAEVAEVADVVEVVEVAEVNKFVAAKERLQRAAK